MDERVDDHPLAELFPLMPDSEIRELAEDIKTSGQQHAIVIYEGKILDGRNRYRACNIARVEPKYAKFPGGDPLKFVLSRNLHRRHLTDAQRAMVAAKIADLKPGEVKSANWRITQPEAAKTLDVPVRTVQRAKAVMVASPKKAAEVVAGTKSLARAEKEIKEAAKPKDKPSDKLPKDDRGVTLPADKVALWNRRGEMKEHAKAISVVRCALEKAQKDDDPLYAHINFSSIKADLDRSFHALASSAPYCVCPMCQGQGCRACKKTGLIGKFQFKTFVPKELKKVGE